MTWTQIDNLPGVERSNAFSFVIGDHAYVGLGSSGSMLHQFIRIFIVIAQKRVTVEANRSFSRDQFVDGEFRFQVTPKVI